MKWYTPTSFFLKWSYSELQDCIIWLCCFAIIQRLQHTKTRFNSAHLNPKDDQLTLATEVQPLGFDSTWNKGGNNYTDHHEVPECKYKSGRVANSNISRTKGSDMFKPESTGVGNGMPASHNKEMGLKGSMVVSMVKLKIVFFTYNCCLINQSISLDSRKSHNMSAKLRGPFLVWAQWYCWRIGAVYAAKLFLWHDKKIIKYLY